MYVCICTWVCGSCAGMSGTWATFPGPSLDLSPLHFTGVENSFPRDKHRLTETYALWPLMHQPFLKIKTSDWWKCCMIHCCLAWFWPPIFYVLDWTFLTLPEEVIGQCKKLLNTTTSPSAIQSLLMKVEPHWFPSTRTQPQGVDKITLVKLMAVRLEKLPW